MASKATRALAVALLVLWLLAAAGPVAADHCPGQGRFAEVLGRAEAIALVRVLRVEGSQALGLFDLTYTFAQIKTWKGALPPVFEVGGSDLGCQFGEDVQPGDQFVVAFGTADEEGDSGGAYWELNADGSLGERGPMDARVQTLAELDVLLTDALPPRGAPPGTGAALMARPLLESVMLFLAVLAVAIGLFLLVRLVRRSPSGGGQ